MQAGSRIVWVLAAALGFVLLTRAKAHALPATACVYGGLPALPKSREDQIRRLRQALRLANSSLATYRIDAGAGLSLLYLDVLAAMFWDASFRYGVPLDLVVGLAHYETRGNPFAPHVARVAVALRISNNGSLCTSGSEVGPMQVKPCAFRDVGMDPARLLSMTSAQRVAASIEAGVKYLALVRRRFGASWCDVLQAYNQGPTAYLRGFNSTQRVAAETYSQGVLSAADQYSELKISA